MQSEADVMHAITIRLGDEEYNWLNEQRGNMSAASFCRDALLASKSGAGDANVMQSDARYIILLQTQVKELRDELKEMRTLLSQAQAISLSLTKQLPGEVAKAKRHWWQFWRAG
jgi:hypothetical protein